MGRIMRRDLESSVEAAEFVHQESRAVEIIPVKGIEK